MKKMECYIEYLDPKNKFKKTKKDFKTYKKAMDFMIKTFDKVNSDFINYY
jgi:hypothetical protein